MNIFSVPTDNMLAVYRLYFEISRLLKDKDNNTACTHPLNTDKKLNCTHAPESRSRSANYKKIKAIIFL